MGAGESLALQGTCLSRPRGGLCPPIIGRAELSGTHHSSPVGCLYPLRQAVDVPSGGYTPISQEYTAHF